MYLGLSEILRLKGRLSDVKTRLKDTLNGVASELIDVNNNIRSESLVASNRNIQERVDVLRNTLDSNLDVLVNFLETQINSYQSTHDTTKESLDSLLNLINSTFDGNGNVIVAPTAAVLSNTIPSTNGIEDYLDTVSGSIVTLPDGLGRSHTYMGWQLITSKSSTQYKLKEAAGMNFDENGFGKIGDRYVVATTTTYGNVGDYIDVVQKDGTVIKGIIGDIKNQNDAGCNKWGHDNGQSVIEFVVDKDSWYRTSKTVDSFHPEWKQSVAQIENKGNYFDLNQ